MCSVAAAHASKHAGDISGWMSNVKVARCSLSSGARLLVSPPCRARPTPRQGDSAPVPPLLPEEGLGRSRLCQPGAEHHRLPPEQLLPPEAQHQVVFSALRGLVTAPHRLPARALLPASAEGVPASQLLSTTKSVLRPIPTGLK